MGYEPGEATTRKGDVSLTAPQHKFMDYETALAADRANQTGVGGKTDWTGEQIQAAPWVQQKALSAAGPTPDPRRRLPRAFAEANKTAPDFFEKHAANATYELAARRQTSRAICPARCSFARGARRISPPRLSARCRLELSRDPIYGGLRVPRDWRRHVHPAVAADDRPLHQRRSGDREQSRRGRQALGRLQHHSRRQEHHAVGRLHPRRRRDATLSHQRPRGRRMEHALAGRHDQRLKQRHRAARSAGHDRELLAHKAVGEKQGLPDVVDTGKRILMANFDPSAPPGRNRRSPCSTTWQASSQLTPAHPALPGPTRATPRCLISGRKAKARAP